MNQLLEKIFQLTTNKLSCRDMGFFRNHGDSEKNMFNL